MELEYAYLAGVIDADGCIRVQRTRRPTRTGIGHRYDEIVTIKQAEREACDLAASVFGGTVRVQKPFTARRRPMFTWSIMGINATRALAAMLPYLRIKRARAENALRLRQLIDTHHQRRWVAPPEIAPDEALVTATEFAKLAGAHPESVYWSCRAGTTPCVKQGRNRMVPTSFLPQFQERMRSGRAPRSAEVIVELEDIRLTSHRLNGTSI